MAYGHYLPSRHKVPHVRGRGVHPMEPLHCNALTLLAHLNGEHSFVSRSSLVSERSRYACATTRQAELGKPYLHHAALARASEQSWFSICETNTANAAILFLVLTLNSQARAPLIHIHGPAVSAPAADGVALLSQSMIHDELHLGASMSDFQRNKHRRSRPTMCRRHLDAL